MKWRLILKNPANQPVSGIYSDWKEQVAEECFHQCIYCSIHETQLGGIDHYHVEHYRPKSLFADLENDICNLYYACPICNRFKSNDWPSEPDLSKPSYPDPSNVDYSTLFTMNSRYELEGTCVAASYVIWRLFLNRYQLILERREETAQNRVNDLIKEIEQLALELVKHNPLKASEALYKIVSIQANLLDLNQRRRRIRPYQLKDIRKREK